MGQNWTLAELEAVVKRGPHVYAMKDDAIAQMQIKAREKAAQGFATIHHWEDLKNKLEDHPQFKLSSLAMISHKSRK